MRRACILVCGYVASVILVNIALALYDSFVPLSVVQHPSLYRAVDVAADGSLILTENHDVRLLYLGSFVYGQPGMMRKAWGPFLWRDVYTQLRVDPFPTRLGDAAQIEKAARAEITKLGLPPPTEVYHGNILIQSTPRAQVFLVRESIRGVCSLYSMLLLPAIAAAFVLAIIDKPNPDAANACPHCGYSLRGLPDDTAVCPECGKPIEIQAPESTG